MKTDLLNSIERVEPAAFTIVLATGAFTLSTLDMAHYFPALALFARILNISNFIIFILLLIFAISTWPFHRQEFHTDLDIPQRAAFYGAIAIAFLVLAAQALRFEMGYWFAFFLWSIGCLSTLCISFAINFHFFVHATPSLQLFTPVFFIPVGGLVVIPVAGIQLMNNVAGTAYDILLIINSLALGGGLLLYLGLFSLLLQRHYITEHLPIHLTPTIWIHLAPIGWGGVSFASMAQQLNHMDSLAKMFTSLLWGGCCWWLIMCLLLTLRAMYSGRMKFSLAYWAFIFPLGSITVLSFKLGPAFLPAFYLTWFLMAIIWCIAAWQTLKSFISYVAHGGHSPK